MARETELGERTEFLGHSYKELEIPPAPDGGFSIEPNALHIWPRGRYMCIALPNDERTFTVTLFLPNESDANPGDPSFATVRNGAEARALFERDFADALPLIPNLERDFEHNPAGLLATLYLDRWHHDDRAVLLGDAAHAMVPFHGQGMNCAFEDCVALADAPGGAATIAQPRSPRSRPSACRTRARSRRWRWRTTWRCATASTTTTTCCNARWRCASPRAIPDRFVPRYAMVTFRRMPYALAFERGQQQRELLVELTRGHATLDTLDWDAVDATVRERLPPLPADA